MTEGETARLIVWSNEIRQVHARLRQALTVTHEEVAAGALDMLVFCHGFCTALDGHHKGEDSTLFPAIAAAHPELRPTLRALEQDHSMIAHLLGALRAAADRGSTAEELDQHLEGIAAIMESHFRYEERALLKILETLDLPADPTTVLGPL
ncbi:hemerythrin domain-containing protein [Pseudonocardia sp. TRM90224]|uniref:hemerythrin domain-containing protein n=1 Tax=Pseudonocardia sp. TRM90224 TaxID=2812678 RepID=UPI001E496FB6|nr:hemerythrin domain-containing protein [Pseudonocardia sp. TRM90224]